MKETGVKHINPTGIFDPTPFAFCHSVQVPSQANLVFISGQSGGVGEDHLLADDFASQVKSALENLKIVLEAHAATVAHVVKITVLIVDHNPQKLEVWTSHGEGILERLRSTREHAHSGADIGTARHADRGGCHSCNI